MRRRAAPLPVTSSLLAPQALLAHVLPQYDLAVPQRCTLWSHGINDVYLVEIAERRYILKLYRAGWRTLPEVLYELDLLHHLQARGVALAPPLADRAGHVAQPVDAPEGQRVAVLFAHVPGRPLRGPHQLTEHESYLLGRALATLHAAARLPQWAPPPCTGPGDAARPAAAEYPPLPGAPPRRLDLASELG